MSTSDPALHHSWNGYGDGGDGARCGAGRSEMDFTLTLSFMNIHAELHLLQVTLPYIIAGMGMVMVGMVLDVVHVGLKWILD